MNNGCRKYLRLTCRYLFRVVESFRILATHKIISKWFKYLETIGFLFSNNAYNHRTAQNNEYILFNDMISSSNSSFLCTVKYLEFREFVKSWSCVGIVQSHCPHFQDPNQEIRLGNFVSSKSEKSAELAYFFHMDFHFAKSGKMMGYQIRIS